MEEMGFSSEAFHAYSYNRYRQARPPLSAIDRFLSNNSQIIQHENNNAKIVKNDRFVSDHHNHHLGGGATTNGGDFKFNLDNQDDTGFNFDAFFADEDENQISLDLIEASMNVSHDHGRVVSEKRLSPEKDSVVINNKKPKKASVMISASASSSLSVGLIKGQWTDDEDRKLIRLVKQYGLRKWAQIAERMTGRAGKQCRERWHNHLRPDIKKDSWSEEEERILVEAHAEVGNRWAEIAKRISGRTENSIKNHWNATKRRQNSRRSKTKQTPQSQQKSPSKPQSSILQNYIKSKTLTTNTNTNTNTNDTVLVLSNTSSTVTEDKIMSSDVYSSTESPLVVPQTYDEEAIFMQNLFTTSNDDDINIPSLVHDDQSHTMNIVNEVASSSSSRDTHLYSDLYMSYLLNGGPTGLNTEGIMVSDVADYVGSDGQYCFSAAGNKRDIDLVEMITSCFSKTPLD